MFKPSVLLLGSLLLFSCQDRSGKSVISELPYEAFSLEDLSDFQPQENWKVVGEPYLDPNDPEKLVAEPGQGVLLNGFDEDLSNLFTNLEHGDIDLRVEVMLPRGSNSGIYLQGRYEIQILDSWGVKDPGHGDMGGIYERWDESRGEEPGYEGNPPSINAAKAPGLWQQFEIKFRAPKFDDQGNKIAHARFEEVWLNGVLVQKDQEVTGPTRGPAYEDESAMGPLMIQGDHGPVAIRNIGYRLYGSDRVTISNLQVSEYAYGGQTIPQLDTMEVINQFALDSLTSYLDNGEYPKKIIAYQGQMHLPREGHYQFTLQINGGGGLLLIDGDTVVNMDGENWIPDTRSGIAQLASGVVNFQYIYNKQHDWIRGFSLEVAGPGILPHPLSTPGSVFSHEWQLPPDEPLTVKVEDEPLVMRSFVAFENAKRTHCLSMGSPDGIHYAYDLQTGALLYVWEGDFIDVTDMWHERGNKQLGKPLGMPVVLSGDPNFGDFESNWPDTIPDGMNYRSLGYELDSRGYPQFNMQVGDVLVRDAIVPGTTYRRVSRRIGLERSTGLWHKIGEGKKIEKLEDGHYAIDDKRYLVAVLESAVDPVIRQSGEEAQLVVRLTNETELIYEIIW